MMGVKIQGLERLEKKLKLNCTMDDVKKVVRKNGADLQRGIQENADFTQGYATGATKRSVDLKIEDGGLTASSGPTTEYAPYVELGTRFMAAQPFIKPGYNEQKAKFKSDMNKLVR